MAKLDAELKRVEMKVSVHCCDGCKKKVKKILRSTQGVLDIEIDTLEPKVTVLGDVEPQTLIKKLLKVGKQAEIWSYTDQNVTKESTENMISPPSIKVESKSSASNHPETRPATNTDKHLESSVDTSKVTEGDKAFHKDTNFYSSTGTIKTGNPILHQPAEASRVVIHDPTTTHDGADRINTSTETYTQQYYYMVEPRSPFVIPYSAVYPYEVPQMCARDTEFYNQEEILFEPAMQSPASTTLGDYFNDENTVGCQIM